MNKSHFHKASKIVLTYLFLGIIIIIHSFYTNKAEGKYVGDYRHNSGANPKQEANRLMEDARTKSNQIRKLGKKIKDMRLTKRVSLRDLAEHTGLTRSFLSQVERGITAPSIASLEKIAQALNIRLSYFFKEEFPEKFSLFRKKRKKEFVAKRAKISCEVLASDILDNAMVPLLFTLDIKGEIGKERLQAYRKERFMFVQKGKIELVCGREGKRKLVLEEGDSLYCKCDVPCKKMSNIGNEKAIVVWVLRAPLL